MRTLKNKYRAKAYSEKETPWRSLVFTLLSARTRDEQTEIVYQKLLEKYPTPLALAKVSPKDIEPHIKNIGLYRNKSKSLSALARVIAGQYRGHVPDDLEKLIALPGAGRKTANCVMIYAFGQPAMCVDTHVHRITNRLGWVKTANAEKTENALRILVPKRFWLDLNRVMVQFGRTVCVPRKPKCFECPVRKWCQFPHKNLEPRTQNPKIS